MSMLDWNGYRQQVLSGVGPLGKLSPDTVKRIRRSRWGRSEDGPARRQDPGADRARRGHQPALHGCITVHTEAAREAGATKEEIAEALGVAVSVNAGAALVYSTRTLDAFDAASNA